MTWILAPALQTFLNEIDKKAPNRSKKSDGTIGDIAHSQRKSDHNPNKRNIVCALDLTNDPKNFCDAEKIAESLRRSRNPRIKYVIWNRRIFSSLVQPWKWRVYNNGENPHIKHLHISVMDEASDNFPWGL